VETFIEAVTPVLVQLFIAVTTLVIGWVGFEVRKLVAANSNDANFQFISQVARVAIEAAEQLYGANAGETKKAYALDYVEKRLAERGIKVDVEAIEAQIEAAILREINYPEIVPGEPGEYVPLEEVVVSDDLRGVDEG
jgi:LL-H family phage holin